MIITKNKHKKIDKAAVDAATKKFFSDLGKDPKYNRIS